MKTFLFLLVRQLFVLCTLAFVSIPTLRAQDVIDNYERFREAYADKKYDQCVLLGEPLAKRTDHPGIQYTLAECYCQTGQPAKSLDLLDVLVERGLSYAIEDNAGFSKLQGDKRFAGYIRAFAKNRVVLDRSVLSFMIKDSLFIPEGIASDSVHHAFFVGSLAEHKVIRCADGGSCIDFVAGERSGFWMVLGMKVSPDHKSLWICSASEQDLTNGHSGIFRFDLSSGELIEKFVMDNKEGDHLFNDIVITRDGNIYFTDSKAGKVWQKKFDNDVLAEYAADFIYPNGIALDEVNKVLFVADFTGLYMIDITTGKRSPLNHQGRTYLNGIDGLYYYKGSLIAIQDSGNHDDRVVRFYYDVKKGTITKARTLQSVRNDFVIPTTGAIVNGHFYYIANSQLRSLQPDGTITNPERLVNPVIFKVKLE